MNKYDVAFYIYVVLNYALYIYVLLSWALHPVLRFPDDLMPFLSVIGIVVITLTIDAYNRLD